MKYLIVSFSFITVFQLFTYVDDYDSFLIRQIYNLHYFK